MRRTYYNLCKYIYITIIINNQTCNKERATDSNTNR